MKKKIRLYIRRVINENLEEKAVSKSQQQFMGMVKNCQDNPKKCDNYSKSVKNVADNIKKTDVKDFASTKHKNLPDHVKESTSKNFENSNIWYHGSDLKISNLKVSQQLKLDYNTEDGAWLTSDKHQAGFYGKYIYEFDCSDLKILDKSKMNKMEFVVNFWVNKIGKEKKMILNYIKLEDKFKDLYDYAFISEVSDNNFDAVKLKGEFNKGYDLWIDYNAIKKIHLIP